MDDLNNKLSRDRKALGFIADKTDDPQLCSLLMVLEESMEASEMMLQHLMENGIETKEA